MTGEYKQGARKSKPFYEHYLDLNLYNDSPIKRYGVEFIKKMHTTSGARFEAARRLKKKNRISTLSILVLTFYAMLFSMISTFDKSHVFRSDVLSLLSLFMSSFVAAFSVYESSKRYDVRSENFLRSARLMQGIRDSVSSDYNSGILTFEKCKDYEEQYFRVLEGHSDNHAHIDLLSHYTSFKNYHPGYRFYIKAQYLFTIYWLLALAIVSPALVFALYFGVTHPNVWRLIEHAKIVSSLGG